MTHRRFLTALFVTWAVLLGRAAELRGGILQRLTGSIDLRAHQHEDSASVTRVLTRPDSGSISIASPPGPYDPQSGAAMTVAYDIWARGSEARVSLDLTGDVWLPWSSVQGDVQLAFRASRPLYYQFTVDLVSISNFQLVRLDDREASLWYDSEYRLGGTLAPVPPDVAPTTHFLGEGILQPGWHTFSAAGQPFIDRSTPVPIAFSASLNLRPAPRAQRHDLADATVLPAMSPPSVPQPAPEPASLLLLVAAVLPGRRRFGR